MTGRYADPFLNALMYSHEITVRGQVEYKDPVKGDLSAPVSVVAGTVNGDRGGSVRRTANVTLDPAALKSPAAGPLIHPYGARIKLWRGLRYAGGAVEEVQVFYGRIDVVETSLAGVSLRCSDLAADIVDARFLDIARPATLPGAPTTILGCIKALITDVLGATTPFSHADITDTTSLVRPGTHWPQERGDALDSLCTQIQGGSEWYMDMAGVANIHKLPAVLTSGTQADWIIDSGDVGVLVDRVATLDRGRVFNGVKVEGEPVGGPNPATGKWYDDPFYGGSATSTTKWGGPFGKVVTYYTGQQVDSNLKAEALAKTLGVNSLAAIRSLAVTCVPNPKLQLGRPVRVFAGALEVDGMYFVQNMTLPLDPESPMTLTLSTAYETTLAGEYRYAEPTIPKGASWRPTR